MSGGDELLKRSFSQCFKNIQDATLIETYLGLGGDVDKANSRGTLLCEAARHKTALDTVKKLIEAGADINSTDKNKSTPLYIAASNGNVETVRYFLEHGARIDEINARSYTALVSSILNGHPLCSELLVRAGANVNRNWPGSTRLLSYVLIGRGFYDLGEQLIRAGLKPHRISLPIFALSVSDKRQREDLFKLLLEAGFQSDCGKCDWLLTSSASRSQSGPVQELENILKDYEPATLQGLARLVIRNTIANDPRTLHISVKIDELPLPCHTKKFLKLEY